MINFHYSNIYDINLAKWRNSLWEYVHELKGKEYTNVLQHEWEQYENIVINSLSEYGFRLPTNTVGYVVNPWDQITAFSDPLTIPIYSDLNVAIVKVIHEFIHIALSYKNNKIIKDKIYLNLGKKYASESYATRIHIAVNSFQESIIKNFPDLQHLLQNEKKVSDNLYPGQKRAWELLSRLKIGKHISDPVVFLQNV